MADKLPNESVDNEGATPAILLDEDEQTSEGTVSAGPVEQDILLVLFLGSWFRSRFFFNHV